jgi:hypothetical protein
MRFGENPGFALIGGICTTNCTKTEFLLSSPAVS